MRPQPRTTWRHGGRSRTQRCRSCGRRSVRSRSAGAGMPGSPRPRGKIPPRRRRRAPPRRPRLVHGRRPRSHRPHRSSHRSSGSPGSRRRAGPGPPSRQGSRPSLRSYGLRSVRRVRSGSSGARMLLSPVLSGRMLPPRLLRLGRRWRRRGATSRRLRPGHGCRPSSPPVPAQPPVQRKLAESSETAGRRAESLDVPATHDAEARGPEPHAVIPTMPVVRPVLGAAVSEPVGRSGDAPFTAPAREDAAAAPTPQRSPESTASATPIGASGEGQTGRQTGSPVRPVPGPTGPERGARSAVPTAPAGAETPPPVAPSTPVQRKVAGAPETADPRTMDAPAAGGRHPVIPEATRDAGARGAESQAAIPVVRPVPGPAAPAEGAAPTAARKQSEPSIVRPVLGPTGLESVEQSANAALAGPVREHAALSTAPVGPQVPPAVAPSAPAGSPIQRKVGESPETVGRRGDAPLSTSSRVAAAASTPQRAAEPTAERAPAATAVPAPGTGAIRREVVAPVEESGSRPPLVPTTQTPVDGSQAGAPAVRPVIGAASPEAMRRSGDDPFTASVPQRSPEPMTERAPSVTPAPASVAGAIQRKAAEPAGEPTRADAPPSGPSVVPDAASGRSHPLLQAARDTAGTGRQSDAPVVRPVLGPSAPEPFRRDADASSGLSVGERAAAPTPPAEPPVQRKAVERAESLPASRRPGRMDAPAAPGAPVVRTAPGATDPDAPAAWTCPACRVYGIDRGSGAAGSRPDRAGGLRRRDRPSGARSRSPGRLRAHPRGSDR